VQALADRPTAYMTLGTIWNRDLDIFRCVINALRNEVLTLIVTVGRNNDPAILGQQPGNVIVHQYVPQGLLLSRCDVVVTHGGSGSTLGPLAFGLPLLVLPQGADQYSNADLVVAAGAGRRLLRDELTPENVRRDVRLLLDEPAYRRAAQAIQTEIAAMPDASSAVDAMDVLLA
jgi:MGT family glycosyltransferase